jgi:cytochrome c oxidase subunit III
VNATAAANPTHAATSDPHLPAEPPVERASPLVVGVVVWLASDIMFFGGLFAAYFVLKAHNAPNWPPPGEELEVARTALFSAVLIASSFTVHRAVVASEQGRPRGARAWLGATIALGSAFLVGEAFEWSGLGFGFDASSFSTIYFLLTGFHGAHVLSGLGLMTIIGWVVFSTGSRAPRTELLRVTSYYWHFVDVVWVMLFLVVYVLR